MESSPEIINMSTQLAQAVEAALNPEMPQEKRHEAYSACEEFKEKSPLSIPCSVYLSVHGSRLVRHFGLQLMEYCVKYKWYEIDQAQKISIKDVTMSLLQSSEGDIAQHIHLKDALSRVIVEMMKREWPQNWPDLLPELHQIASEGCIQAEVVLLIFLRFVEDVVVLQTLEYAQRRRDLYHHLMLNLEGMFVFLLSLMAQHYKLNVPESVRVINLSLKLLSEIVEFAFVNRIAAEETPLVPVLCNLLSDENFQLETAECLNRIAQKKGKHEDKRMVCKLLLNSTLIQNISQLNLMVQNGTLNDRNYLFIKKVSELLLSLSSLLCTVMKNDTDNPYNFVKPEILLNFLEILVNLCKHSSLVVAVNVNACWTTFFKNSVLNKNSCLLNYVTKWVSAITPKLIKISYNPENSIPMFQDCYKYLAFDFDSEHSFSAFYYRFRLELFEAYRYLTQIAPEVVFSCFEQWLSTLIQKTTLSSNAVFSRSSQEYLEWEAISSVLEVIISNIPQPTVIPIERGVRLLDLCFGLKPSDPNISSFLLSCISPLIFFVHNAPTEVSNVYLPQLLERLFTNMVFEIPEENPFERSREVLNLRRHASCLLLKLSRKYPPMFLPFFDHIRNVLVDFKQNPNGLTRLELVVFIESLITINNCFQNYERQSAFIKDVLDEVKEYWINLTVEVFSDHSKFSLFIGLQVEPAEFQATTRNRSELMYCIDLISAVIKRSTWPETKEAALKGGFLIPMINANREQPIYQNPASPHTLPLLPGIFSIIKIIHCLWTPEARSKLPAGYEKIHDIMVSEVKSLFGVHLPNKEVNRRDLSKIDGNMAKMQVYLCTLYESCFSILAKTCQNLANNFYDLPNFVPSFGASVFYNLDSVPDYRLRSMIKIFFRPFVGFCPAEKHDILLVPILGYFCNYMYERLLNKWKYLQECRDNGKYNEDDSEDSNKETIEHYLNIALSREYMDVVKSLLMKTTLPDAKQCNSAFGSEELTSPVGSQNNLHFSPNAYDAVSELGIKLLRCEETRNGIMNFILSSISWTDSTNSLKASLQIPVIVRQLATEGNVSPDMVAQIIISLLQGLQIHGQHDANQGALLNNSVLAYQLFRPKHPKLREIMTMVPGINMEDLQKFDQKSLKITTPAKIEKGMKEMFKKLVYNLIGRNIGQLFKRKETIRGLPKLNIPRVKGESILNLSGNEDDIGIANFFK